MNIFDEHPFKVIMDYAHNPAAVRTICQVVERLDTQGRKIIVLSAPGDRRDEDIKEIAAMAAGGFDHYICRRDDYARGRKPTEVPELLQSSLIEQGVDGEKIQIIVDEVEANDAALQQAQAGDLVLILCDAVTRSWKQIINFTPDESVQQASSTASPVADIDMHEFLDFTLDSDIELIRDEKGVRLAMEQND